MVDPRAWYRDRRGTRRRLSVTDVGVTPDIDWPDARLRSVMGLYLLLPLVLLAGPIWLFGWIAAFVAPMNTVKKCKTFAKRTGRLTYDR